MWPSVVPFFWYRSLIFFVNFLLFNPVIRLFGIALSSWLRNSKKNLSKVLSTSTYSNNWLIFSIGLPRYSPIFALALDIEPVIVSPIINFVFAVMYSLLLSASSTKIVAVWPDVVPVIISPDVNSPYSDCSSTI